MAIFLVGSAALFSGNIQQITILTAHNESDEEMNVAKSCSLSDLRHEAQVASGGGNALRQTREANIKPSCK